MNFKDLVYDNTHYLSDRGFNIQIIDNCIYIYKDGIYDLEYFKWDEVCDELEPLIIILDNSGLLSNITIYDGDINFYFDILNLNNTFEKISEIYILDITINC